MPASATPKEIRILKDSAAIARLAADKFMGLAQDAAHRKGSFDVALAGGSTPKVLYSLLVSNPDLRDKLPWGKIHFFFGDERHVGPDDSQSNYKMAFDTIIGKVPIGPDQVHRIRGEFPDAEQAALAYERLLKTHFIEETPRFDLVLVGMGDEGHCLSLFPGTKALHAPAGRTVVSNWVGKLFTDRITITAPVANNAEMILFMVAGKEKALALKGVLEGPYEPEQLPAQLLQPTNGKLLWLVDEAAGSMLTNAIRE